MCAIGDGQEHEFSESRVVDITWSLWHQKVVVHMSTHTTHQEGFAVLFSPIQLVGRGMGFFRARIEEWHLDGVPQTLLIIAKCWGNM